MSKVWIAKKPCGCIVAASIADQDRDNLVADIGDWVLRGLTVECVEGPITMSFCKHEVHKHDQGVQGQPA